MLALTALSVALVIAPETGSAQYYDNVDDTNAVTLRLTLHATIDNHRRIPYTRMHAGQTNNIWTVLEQADEAFNIVDAGSFGPHFPQHSFAHSLFA